MVLIFSIVRVAKKVDYAHIRQSRCCILDAHHNSDTRPVHLKCAVPRLFPGKPQAVTDDDLGSSWQCCHIQNVFLQQLSIFEKVVALNQADRDGEILPGEDSMRVTSSLFASTMLASMWFNSASFAQVEKSDLEISFSGSLGWSETRIEGAFFPETQSTSTRFGVSARVGYFVSRRVDVGGIIGASYSDFDNGDSYGVSIGPAANFHLRPDTDIVPFIGVAAGIIDGESNSSGSSGESKQTYDGWFAEARGGADFFLTPHVAIKLQLRYRRQDTDSETRQPFQQASQTWNTSSDDVATLVGFAIFLDTKK